jgi:prepilin-type N-terminal cleavage/methylation domain-containing protein
MKSRPSGFTLIELMVVVAIIGLLSSIAIPTFRNMQLRSKQAERAIVMSTIDTALQDYWVRESRYPRTSGTDSYLSTSWNPDWPPGTQKRPFMKTAAYGDWNRLSVAIDGNLYYCYYAYAYAGSSWRYRYVYAYGDLDGDRQYNYAYNYAYDYSWMNPPQQYRYSYDSATWDPAF